ncbi:hypothetical protein FAM23868_001963 [Propionibacterium freudenreichii]|uniref:hypothetical protein n=1 Tax=Propionibacterium freudenreichii TaxID=1744 RepID=UPI00254B1F49|nr:hypothetical protein [Propionibacterium freudenreichii]MDK9332623.1 hypothetical protein [Propionibacterium freudenreichii]
MSAPLTKAQKVAAVVEQLLRGGADTSTLLEATGADRPGRLRATLHRAGRDDLAARIITTDRAAQRRREVIEAVEKLVWVDRADEIAAELGYSSRYALQQSLRRWGRRDLASRIVRTSETHRDRVIADVEWIAGTRDPEDVARATGYRNATALHVALTRWGRKDLADRVVGASRDDTGRFRLHTLGRIR